MVAFSTLVLCATLGAAPQAELLEFYTDSCPHCKAMEPALSRLRTEGLAIRKSNADRERQLSDQMQIKAVPTLVLLVDGQEVDRWEGVASFERLKQWLGEHLPERNPDRFVPPTPTQVRQTGSERNVRSGLSSGSGFSSGSGLPSSKAAPSAVAARDPLSRSRGERSGGQIAPSDLAAPIANALQSTVRLQIDDPTGTSKGSGTIIDRRGEDALILTCGHIFRDSNGKGAIMVDLFQPDGTSRQIAGRLLDFDLSRDLALVTIRATDDLPVARIARPSERFAAGDPVFSLGCDRGDAPRVFASEITAISQYYGPPNITARGEPTIGRSGGGLFNQDGVLIGVCNFASPSDHTGIYAAVESVHAELTRVQLQSLFEEPVEQLAAAREVDATQASATSDRPASAPSRGLPRQQPAPDRVAGTQNMESDSSLRDAAEIQSVIAGQSPEADEETEAIIVLPARKNARSRAEILHIKRLDPSMLDRLREQSATR
jgi:S1-C subfamily serine protease